jgi:hypothetical protein
LRAGSGRGKAGAPGRAEAADEAARSAVVVHGKTEALELVGRGPVQTGGDEQAVERELEVEPAGGAVADGHAELLLEGRTGPEAQVVVGPEEVRAAELAQLPGELAGGCHEKRVVAVALRAKPLGIVVVLEVAEELEGLRRPHDRRARRSAPR